MYETIGRQRNSDAGHMGKVFLKLKRTEKKTERFRVGNRPARRGCLKVADLGGES